MVTDSEQEVAEAFRASDYAPTGEWWSGFPLGFGLESGNIREADGVCITSRSADGPDMEARRSHGTGSGSNASPGGWTASASHSSR